MRNILFITRDEKADWWCDPYKLTHCRHELMDEYRAKTNFLFNTITVNEFGARQNFSDETQQDVESNALLSQDSITPDIFSLIEQLRDDCFEGIRRAELIEQTYSITDQQTLRDMMITANTFYHTVQDHLYHIRQKKMIEFMESRHAITYAFDSSRLFEQTFMNMPFDYGLREEHVRRIIELGFKLIEVIRKYKPKYGDYIFRYYSETVAATLSTVLHRPLNPQQQPKTTP